MANGRLAYDPGGRVFAIACGSELLAHDGESEAPLWKSDLGEEIAAIEMSGDEIVALVASGSIVRFAWKDGREVGRIGLARPAHAIAAGAGGWLAAAHEQGVSIVRRGDFAAITLDHDGVRALAWSGDATKLLLGTEGALLELTRPERASGEARRVAIEGTPAAIAWSAKGAWLIAAGDRVTRLEPGAADVAHVTRAGGQTVTDVAVSLDGRRLAIQIGDDLVAVLDDPPKDTLAQLRYPERKASGVRFGPGTWLGVALDTGDANKLDYATGALHRSDTHPGRAHNSWLVMVSVPALEAKKQAAGPARRAPAAPAPVAYDDPPPPADEGPSPFVLLRIGLAILLFLLALVRLMDR